MPTWYGAEIFQESSAQKGHPMADYHTSPSQKLTNLQSIAALQQFLDRKRCPDETFEECEKNLGVLVRRVECEIKEAELVRYDVNERLISVEGKQYQMCLEQEPKTYLSTSGPVTIPRNLFRPVGGGKAICALELRVGVIGPCTPLLARQTSFLMGLMTSGETASVFDELGVEGPSASTCDRLPKLINPVWEKDRKAWEAVLQEQETVPAEATVLAVSLDGVMVPDKNAQKKAKVAREEAEKKGLKIQASGPAGYREVGCGTVTLYSPPENPDSDDPEERAPTRLETVRYARAPEYKKKTLTEQLDAEVDSILAARSSLELVALADGAEENWRYFDGEKWKNAVKIVDYGHASQHLKSALNAYYGDTIDARADYERLKLILRDKVGGIDDVINELESLDRKLYRQKHPRRRKLLRKELKYFKNQRERMDYAWYQALGLPIGSGVVEAACKTLAAQRLKRSGMNWGDGKQPILTIRSLQQSDRWNNGWPLVAGAFRKDVCRVFTRGHLSCTEQIRLAA